MYCVVLLILTQGYFFYGFFERVEGGREGERERGEEKQPWERDTLNGCFPHIPRLGWESNPQPR